MKKLPIITWIIIFVINFCPMTGYGDQNMENRTEFVKAEIFYYDWSVERRSALTPEMVRTNYWSRMTIVNKIEVNRFIEWLQIDKMRGNNIKEVNDVRLVIDLFDSKANRKTYIATQFYLMSEDTMLKRRIDGTFKSKFSFRTH